MTDCQCPCPVVCRQLVIFTLWNDHGLIAEGKKLSDLIQFVTGTPYLPGKLGLSFSEEIAFPVAHACFNHLELPTGHRDYAEFRDAIICALQHGDAFTAE